MFDDLFGQENNTFSSFKQNPNEPPKALESPFLPGLNNPGTMCYLTSLIQILHHLPPYRNLLYSLQSSPLQEVSLNLQYLNQQTQNLPEIFIQPGQQDLLEAFQNIIGQIPELESLFTFQQEIEISCKCQTRKNIQDNLFFFIQSDSSFIGSCGCDTQIKERFKKANDIVIGVINRFDYENGEKVKKVKKVVWEDSLMIKEQEYEVSGVIVHKGDAYSGHYWALVKDILNEGEFDIQEKPKKPVQVTKRKTFKKKSQPRKQKVRQRLSKKLVSDSSDDEIQIVISGSSNSENEQKMEIECQNWYEFNDEKVTPIKKDRLKNFYGSNKSDQCAYLIFYLKKQAYRNVSASEFFQQKVDQANKALEILRINYNQISIFLDDKKIQIRRDLNFLDQLSLTSVMKLNIHDYIQYPELQITQDSNFEPQNEDKFSQIIQEPGIRVKAILLYLDGNVFSLENDVLSPIEVEEIQSNPKLLFVKVDERQVNLMADEQPIKNVADYFKQNYGQGMFTNENGVIELEGLVMDHKVGMNKWHWVEDQPGIRVQFRNHNETKMSKIQIHLDNAFLILMTQVCTENKVKNSDYVAFKTNWTDDIDTQIKKQSMTLQKLGIQHNDLIIIQHKDMEVINQFQIIEIFKNNLGLPSKEQLEQKLKLRKPVSSDQLIESIEGLLTSETTLLALDDDLIPSKIILGGQTLTNISKICIANKITIQKDEIVVYFKKSEFKDQSEMYEIKTINQDTQINTLLTEDFRLFRFNKGQWQRQDRGKLKQFGRFWITNLFDVQTSKKKEKEIRDIEVPYKIQLFQD